MSINELPLFRRLHKHAAKRLVFDPGVPRHQQLPAYKRFIQLENIMLERYHRKGDSGLKTCRARAAMVDVVIENLFLSALNLYAKDAPRFPCKVAILATGGYGRAELNPHSDIDILFLYPLRVSQQKMQTFQEILTEEILYPLWDLGFKVGHASRNWKESIEEARAEIQSKNALLESRLICGSASVYEQMQSKFKAFCEKENAHSYILQRLEDESIRHAKFGNTLYLQEPDIKNGVGGLRDFQNILWMANIKYGYSSLKELVQAKYLRNDERIAIRRAYNFLLRTRTELHLQNRRPTDKIGLEQQAMIAEQLGYQETDIFERVEHFMKDYYRATRSIYQTSELLKERMALSVSHQQGGTISFREALNARTAYGSKEMDGFILEGKTLRASSRSVFKKDPIRIIRVFRLLQQFSAKLHPDLKYQLSRSIPFIDKVVINSPSAAKAFCSILRSPGEVYPTLLLMHEIGILERYLPEFGKLTCMVQHEYYHRYTADAHVLRTIRHLDRVFTKFNHQYAGYESVLRKNEDPLLLYLILLLHDIGKAEGIKGHAENGVRIARPILERFHISDPQQEQILFIIGSHLEMARFWQRFDLDDPQTARSFASFIQTPDKLRFLFVHTFCDAHGTAPNLWNDYKNSMHHTLFNRTLEQLQDQDVLSAKRVGHKDKILDKVRSKLPEEISTEEVDAHFSLLPERYFLHTGVDELALHLQMIHQLLNQIQHSDSLGSLAPIINWRNDVDLNMTIVNVVTWDRAGLFYKLAGALSLAGVSISNTRAISRGDHISIDTFYVMDPQGGRVTQTRAKEVFERHLNDCLIHGKELLPAIIELEAQTQQNKPKEPQLAPFPPTVNVYHELSLKRTILEVQAVDRIGLLYRLAREVTHRGFNISFARVATERDIAMDTFYIENIQQNNDQKTNQLVELRSALEAVIQVEG